MSKTIIHISFRSDEETLEQIGNDFTRIPKDESGFPFHRDKADYEHSTGEIQQMLIMVPDGEITDEQAYNVLQEYLNLAQYEYLEVVFFCEGQTSGDVIRF